MKDSVLKLNLGCGGRPLKNYVNVDMDTLEEMKKRYPNQQFDDNLIIKQYDLFNLPYEDNSVDEVRADGLIEHLPFVDESRFFHEVKRVLKIGGVMDVSTVDFQKTVKQWLSAEDDWKGFFKDDEQSIHDQHWFGTYTYKPENRWGYLTATFYGSQNGEGQFHTNCYTDKKLSAICKYLDMDVVTIDKFQWKGDRDYMLRLIARNK
jgi:predicted SAM-dependent methyltransferase